MQNYNNEGKIYNTEKAEKSFEILMEMMAQAKVQIKFYKKGILSRIPITKTSP